VYRRYLFLALCLLASTCGEADGVPDALVAACQREAECAGQTLTVQGERECRQRWLTEYEQASSNGCATPHADWVACLGATECPPEESVEPCESQQLAFQQCQGRTGRGDCFVRGLPARDACQ
jgi:hypothetical protein